jgi:dihydroxyacetone kinase-like predicted kinase
MKKESKNNIQQLEDENKNKKNTGVIAVSQGEGLNEIFKSMGADIIEGGQSMNPSTEDILSVVEKKAYYNTVILPNNKNIILTAEQVKKFIQKQYLCLADKINTSRYFSFTCI